MINVISDPIIFWIVAVMKQNDHFVSALVYFSLFACVNISSFLLQGKFVRIHFGPTGKIAGADIETCKLFLVGYTIRHYFCMLGK